MDSFEFLSLLPQFIGVVANLLIFGAAVYAIVMRPSLATGLMLFGTFARLVSGLFFSLGIWFFEGNYEQYAMILLPFQILALAGAIAFIIGFFLFAYKLFSTPAEV